METCHTSADFEYYSKVMFEHVSYNNVFDKRFFQAVFKLMTHNPNVLVGS